MRKAISVMLILAILIPILEINIWSMGQGNNAIDLKYKDGYLFCTIPSHAATTGVRFKTIGFTIYFADRHTGNRYQTTIKLEELPNPQTIDGIVYTNFEIPFAGELNTIESRFAANYKGLTPEVLDFLLCENDLYADAIFTIVEYQNGVPKKLGDLNEDGSTWGEVYFTLDKIRGARKWGQNTWNDFVNYYGLKCHFPGVPISPTKLEPPIAKISHDKRPIADSLTGLSDSATFTVGKISGLTGMDSVFPQYAAKCMFAWSYRKEGGYWVVLNGYKQGEFVPNHEALNKLPVGNYELKLIVAYQTEAHGNNNLHPRVAIGKLIIKGEPVPNEPTVTALVSPTQAKTGGTQSAKVYVSGDVLGYDKTKNKKITKLTLYCKRLKSVGYTDEPYQTYELPGENTHIEKAFDFSINTQGQEFTQAYKATIVASFEDGTYAQASTNTSQIYTKANVPTAPPPPAPPPPPPVPPAPDSTPPIAIIDAPLTVKVGEQVLISGARSYGINATIMEYWWTLEGTASTIGKFSSKGNVVYNQEGQYRIDLMVVDSNSKIAYDRKIIKVLPPAPTAIITTSGILKEGRVMTIDSSKSSSPADFPIVPSKTEWTVTPVSGTGADNRIYRVSGQTGTLTAVKFTGVQSQPIGILAAGDYDVTLRVYNTKGLWDETTKRIMIEKDVPPEAKLKTVAKYIRDTDLEGTMYAEINIADLSYSTDGDYIARRSVYARYDANNNNNFYDAADKIIPIQELTGKESIDNAKTIQYHVRDVGRYQFFMEVEEGYAESFNYSVFLSAVTNTYAQVINTAPTVSFSMIPKKSIEVVLNIGNTKYTDLTTVEEKCNTILKPALLDDNIIPTIKIVKNESRINSVLDSGKHHSAAIKQDGTVWTWGYNTYGQLGNGAYAPMTEKFSPTQVAGFNNIKSIKCGDYHTIALQEDGTVWGWGRNSNGELGNGWMNNMVAYPIKAKISDVTAISAGYMHTAAVKKDGTVWYWGDYNSGGSIIPIQIPGLNNVIDIGAGVRRTLILKQDGTIWNYDHTDSTLLQIQGLINVKQIAAGSYTNAVLKQDGTVWFWRYDGDAYRTPTQINGMSGVASIAAGVFDIYMLKDDGTVWGHHFDHSGNPPVTFKVEGLSGIKTISALIRTANGADSDGNVWEWDYISGQPVTAMDVRKVSGISNTMVNANSQIQKTICGNPWSSTYRYGIYLDDKSISELEDQSKTLDIINGLSGSNISFIGLGTSANRAQISKIGKFINNSSLDNALVATADYINAGLNSSNPYEVPNACYLQNEAVDVSAYTNDYEHDPKYTERWRYLHDPNYFDNGAGLMVSSGQYLSAPIQLFDKPGKYTVLYENRDNPKEDNAFDSYRLWSNTTQDTFYIHRKPTALFTIDKNQEGSQYRIAITDYSYDLDHNISRASTDKGIVEKKWQYKELNTADWINGFPPALISAGKTYMVRLTVKDMEGAWSAPYTLTFTTDTTIVLPPPQAVNTPPNIDAVPQQVTWTNQDITANITASDQEGLKEVRYIWTNSTQYPSGVNWSIDTKTNLSTVKGAEGVWYLHMMAIDAEGLNVYRYRGPYEIDKTAPGIDIQTKQAADSVEANVSLTDAGGSGLKTIKYKWTNTKTKPASGWSIKSIAAPGNSAYTLKDTKVDEGTWYLHIEAADYAGNVSYSCSSPVTIAPLEVTGVTIEGYWNHWRGQKDMFGKQLTNEPHRFLSLERVKINVYTTGYADKVEIRFSPELEAMQFTDKYGNVYDYKEKVGYYVSFPQTVALDGKAKDNHVYWEYILPLAPSTKSWEDVRLRGSYRMTVTAWKGSQSVTYTVEDIEITGNTYDLIYVQPIG